MGKVKQAVMSEEQKKELLNKSLFMSEAFWITGGSDVSMNTLMEELLEPQKETQKRAKTDDSDPSTSTADEISGIKRTKEQLIAIYKRHNIDYRTLGSSADLLEIVIRDHYMEQEGFDDPTPLCAEWLYHMARSTAALCELYKGCLRVVRHETKKPAFTNIMNMLHLEYNAFLEMVYEAGNKERTLLHIYDIFLSRPPDYVYIPDFPLLVFFLIFQEKHGNTLADKYGIPYHQSSIHERYPYRYWDDTDAIKEARKKLKEVAWENIRNNIKWDGARYTVKSWKGEERTEYYDNEGYEEDVKHLVNLEDEEIAKKILAMLDRYTERRLRHVLEEFPRYDGVQFKLDSATGRINIASTSLDTALALWMVTQMQRTEDCQVCLICGRVFKLRAQKGRLTCYLHPDHTSDYFKRKLKEKKAKMVQHEEDAHFKVVYGRNNSEITFDPNEEDTEETAECC